MRRDYSLDQYRDLVGRLQGRHPGLNVTTDLIVGFPGETEEDYELSVAAVRSLGFGAVHVFPYSKRQDTRAERMPHQVPEVVKADRSRRLQALAKDQRAAKMAALVGQTRRILVETPNEGRGPETWVRGLTEDYFPVRFRGEGPWNSFVDVVLDAVIEDGEWLFSASRTPVGS